MSSHCAWGWEVGHKKIPSYERYSGCVYQKQECSYVGYHQEPWLVYHTRTKKSFFLQYFHGRNSFISPTSKGNTDSVLAKSRVQGIAYLCWSNLNVEITALIGNFQDLRPSKTINSQSVFVNEKAISTHTQLDVHTLRVLPSINHSTVRMTSYIDRGKADLK